MVEAVRDSSRADDQEQRNRDDREMPRRQGSVEHVTDGTEPKRETLCSTMHLAARHDWFAFRLPADGRRPRREGTARSSSPETGCVSRRACRAVLPGRRRARSCHRRVVSSFCCRMLGCLRRLMGSIGVRVPAAGPTGERAVRLRCGLRRRFRGLMRGVGVRRSCRTASARGCRGCLSARNRWDPNRDTCACAGKETDADEGYCSEWAFHDVAHPSWVGRRMTRRCSVSRRVVGEPRESRVRSRARGQHDPARQIQTTDEDVSSTEPPRRQSGLRHRICPIRYFAVV